MKFLKITRALVSIRPRQWSHADLMAKAVRAQSGVDTDPLIEVGVFQDADVPSPLPTGVEELADQAAWDSEAAGLRAAIRAAVPVPPPDPDRDAIDAILDKADADVSAADVKELLLRLGRRLRSQGAI